MNERDIEQELLEQLKKMGAGAAGKFQEIITTLAAEMQAENPDDTEMLFCGSDGNFVVKGLHYPEDLLGDPGPVVFPSSNPLVVLGAYSDEYIRERSDEIRNLFEEPEDRERAWEKFLNECAIQLAAAASELMTVTEEEFEKLLEENQ
jgi:hypothetical protein